jgi:hypothetical protein
MDVLWSWMFCDYGCVVTTVESLQSHWIHTHFHWSSGPPICFPVMSNLCSIPRGVLMWNQDSPVSVVSLHWWLRRVWSLWPCLRRASSEPSLGHRANNVIIPLDLTHLFCPGFTLAAGPPSGFTTDIVAAGGSPVESLQSHCTHTQFHWSSGPPVCFSSWGTRVQSPGGYLYETGILLLVLSCYTMDFLWLEMFCKLDICLLYIQ